MKICLFCCLLLVSATVLQAQGLIQYAFERLGKQSVRGCEKTAGLCTPALLKAQQSAAERLQAAHLKRVLDQQAHKARQEYGTPSDMLRYFTAKLYGDCLVNKAQCPAYQTLENILEQKYRTLDYKTCFKEDL